MFFILPQSGRQTLKFIKNKNAFPLKSSKAFIRTLIDDLRKEAEKMRKSSSSSAAKSDTRLSVVLNALAVKKATVTVGQRFCSPTLL